jgi:ribosomal protein L34E
MKLIEDEKCPRCGKEFTCSKSGKCWCFEISVIEVVRERINEKYDTCLCPNCLTQVSKGAEV